MSPLLCRHLVLFAIACAVAGAIVGVGGVILFAAWGDAEYSENDLAARRIGDG